MAPHDAGLRGPLKLGLIFGVVQVFVSLAGVVETFHGRLIISGIISLGQGLLVSTAVGAGYLAARRMEGARLRMLLLRGGLAGAVTGALLAGLVLLGTVTNLRAMFVNASPVLYDLLTLGRGPSIGAPLLVVLGAIAGILGALASGVPGGARRPIAVGLTSVLVLSLFQDLVQLILQREGLLTTLRDFLYTDGPTLRGAVAVFVLTVAAERTWGRIRGPVGSRVAQLPPAGRRTVRLALLAAGVSLVLFLPIAGGPFVAQALVIVGLFTLMGLGLNLEVGLAGLLDLGFVAFFAIGAYTVGLLTSIGPLAIAGWSFWAAVPVAVIISLIAGVILGIPVLGIRGDYLAIATLGFGEITRLMVLSDFLRPWLGGSQGVLQIPKPFLGTFEFAGPQHLFYITLVGSALVAFVAWRLQNSRLGRAWMAIREDEDVAEALGVNLVSVKLLAYGLGAAFAGVAGAIFAVMVGSVFPHSFSLIVSINVLALIIVGGLASTPGVMVGSLALVGLPELLREFGEFRFLVYGAVLVAMMLLRPEGLLPAKQIRQELREEPAEAPAGERVPAKGVASGGAVEG